MTKHAVRNFGRLHGGSPFSQGSGSSLAATLIAGGLLAAAALPLVALVVIAAGSGIEHWSHLVSFVLPTVAADTLILLFLVGLGTATIGTVTAWLTEMHAFPGRSVFSWALMLPLAVPTYIAAYSWVEVLGFTGPVQSAIRLLGDFQTSREYWFPDIRSPGGAALIFTLVLFPYVFLTCRIAFRLQGAAPMEVARTLGARPLTVFLRVGLPMARPAIAAGTALALMEALNDIGAVEYLGVRTITFAVFDTWLNRDSLGGAVQLALLALLVVALLLWLERRARRASRISGSVRERLRQRIPLYGIERWLAFAACLLPVVMGFGIPLYLLSTYVARRLGDVANARLLDALMTSATIAVSVAVITMSLATLVLLTARLGEQPQLRRIGRIASLGYAVPGTVLAIGLLVPIAAFDNLISGWARDLFGYRTGLLLSGSLFIIVYACSLRFLAIAWGSMDNGLSRLPDRIDMAGRALGRGPVRLVAEVHLPILRPVILAGFLLVFVDSLKELSATLLLRPLGVETLATLVYDQASQAAVEEGAWASLLIVLAGIIPVVLLTRLDADREKKRARKRGP